MIRNTVAALADLGEGLRRWPLWLALAGDDMRQRYRRTVFGLLWITISYAAFVGALTLVFGQLSPEPLSWFVVYVAVGFLAWQFINASVVDGCQVFVNSENWLTGMRLPHSVFIFQSVARECLVLGYSALVALAVMLMAGHALTPMALMALPALAAFIVNAVFAHMLFGVAATRFRDLSQVIQAVMRVLFFLTPLVWTAEQVGGLRGWLWWNPFTYFVDIFRAPIVDGVFPAHSWAVVAAITAGMAVVSLTVFTAFRRRLTLWL
ncbi:MAG: ABC transporter permease [Maricaulaceae bacterium]|nr:ABC transporter permease [Maricaulaceae bacterium]